MPEDFVIINGRKFTDSGLIWFAPYMNAERAAFVANLRVNEEYSFRGICDACAAAWDEPWETNQITGMALCKLAAAYLGKDSLDSP